MSVGGNGAPGDSWSEGLRALERRYRTVIEQAPLSVHVFRPDGHSLLANSSWNALWNLREGEEPEGSSVFEDEQIQATGLVPYIEESLEVGGPVTPPPLLYDPARTGREGDPRWLQAFVYPVKDERESVHEVTLIIEDVTERKALEERLFYQAYHDELTGLPNRPLLLDRLDHALIRANRRGGKVALLFTDLDNFKYVNDSLGHEAGDRLLVGVAERLRTCVRPEDTVARLGGDEFVLLIEETSGLEEATAIAGRVAWELRPPFELPGGHEVFVTTSTGVVLGGRGQAGGGSAEELLRSADAAMYRGKEAGKDRYEVYEAGLRTRASERLKTEADLKRALERGELRVHYQPKVELRSGRIVGFEALVRWQRPGHGLVPPLEFVPLAEETGLIVPIGRWVMREACGRARALAKLSPGGRPLTMCVNLSARQFRHPMLVEEVAGIVEETGAEPGGLILEITESVVMGDAAAAATMEALKALGIALAVDDFGTGFSSLSYLKRLPVDYLKIDRSFVAGICREADDEVIVSAMVELAHALNREAIAEGVENEAQLARLREMGCETAQGYHFSEPLAQEALAGWLVSHASGQHG
jgi:diguanylate cyclase (GGDEF)-like protein/PAS domain S-box-containing protein